MTKFTIFTVILSISVITVTADLAIRDYFAQDMQANVLEDISPVISEGASQDEEDQDSNSQNAAAASANPTVDQIANETTNDRTDAGEPAPIVIPSGTTITQEIVRQAGFSGDLQEKEFSGKVFQLLDITKIPVDNMAVYEIAQDGIGIVSITEVSLRDEIRALQLYILLQNKTKTYIDLSLNETNAYGDRSFYINHAKKPDEAFLTVKIGKMVYAFAYVKTYHPQLKNLIKLLTP